MSLRRHALLLAATAPVALGSACSGPPPAPADENQVGSMGAPATEIAPNQSLPAENTTTPVEQAKTEAAYVGKWIGVEGMVLDVKAKPGGGVTIVNQWDLDNKGTFEGSVTAEGLSFVRGGKSVVAKPSDGDATGLKYLAGKKDCLTVAEGEGYCRD
jgi:hypothetical protein